MFSFLLTAKGRHEFDHTVAPVSRDVLLKLLLVFKFKHNINWWTSLHFSTF